MGRKQEATLGTVRHCSALRRAAIVRRIHSRIGGGSLPSRGPLQGPLVPDPTHSRITNRLWQPL